ncbi:MAG: DUF433 domain-containing protein [Candidatus Dormibacteraeota bacterium]|nr:DUF433 domain-containing protein [Candidatus Dormibacteraeota bacterium]
MSAAILELPLYTFGEAARLLELQPWKVRRWVEGAVVQGVAYPPVIRPAPTGSNEVTWAEFVEAGFLREYRVRGVTLQHIRPFIDRMRKRQGVSYPLAHFRPKVDLSDHQLMVELKQLQDDVGLEDELALVRAVSGQLVWAEPMRGFLDKVEFDAEGVTRRMHPLGKGDPVVIDPEVSFGVPQIRGIRTETITEAFATGESPGQIADSYDLGEDEVMAAVRWELRLRPRTQAA